ncbi:hypothetical protein HRG_002248 [Hirsutella rhossiliensis]|uniref:Uncharacterized protein n=1 Tax=Hirsutella rhossiliensis TaxID=111463 RepID=A0A9P8N6T1_9HYPO|nr:uncharacterized protein HRG_02248 [Hirsutella rhossiliensis]KAH0966839.1 hypothetical protein HRG_02248 [Hirsutella rhossiliensis]
MTTLPGISQLKSLIQAITGDTDGARKTQEEFFDAWEHHLGHTVSELVDAVPIIGNIKGLVHFAVGDYEGGLHAEEAATRSLVVMTAAAAVAGTGGAAAPIFAGVVAGIASDGIITGIESGVHHKYDPQGMISVGTNIVNDVRTGEEYKLGGDFFDGIVIAASDGILGSATVKGTPVKTTKIYRVEGKSLIRTNNGAKVNDFFAGDNQRIFTHKGVIYPRERLPDLRPPEELGGKGDPKPDPGDNEIPDGPVGEKPDPKTPEEKGKKGKNKGKGGGDPSRAPFGSIGFDPSIFKDNGKFIFLNFGEADRMYQYYAQKLVDHRTFVEQYREKFTAEKGAASTVTKDSHDIRVKSFEVLTRDIGDIEKQAVLESQKSDAVKASQYNGVLKVDVKADGQFGLESWRYTPIFEKMVPGTFRATTPWIAHLPTALLKLIRDHPVAFGKVRTFKYANAAGSILLGNSLLNLTSDNVTREDVAPQAILHCRHVKGVVRALEDNSTDWSEHYEYLVKFDKDSPAAWYPADFIAEDLRQNFYDAAARSAKPISRFEGRDGPRLRVERPDGSVDTIDETQIFWREQDDKDAKDDLDPRELDAVLYHISAQGRRDEGRISLGAGDQLPPPETRGEPPAVDGRGQGLYFGSAINLEGAGGVTPCKIVLDASPPCMAPLDGREVPHNGTYDFLPFSKDRFELVPSEGGTVPDGCDPVVGGYEKDKQVVYHALGHFDKRWIPGKAGPQFKGAMVAEKLKERHAPKSLML